MTIAGKQPRELIIRYGLLIGGSAEVLVLLERPALSLTLLLTAGFLVTSQVRLFLRLKLRGILLSLTISCILLIILFPVAGWWPWILSAYLLFDLFELSELRFSVAVAAFFIGAGYFVMSLQDVRLAVLVGISLVVLAVLAHVNAFNARSSRRLSHMFHTAHREIGQLRQEMDSQNRSLSSLQELYTLKERNRISREIHDSVGHRLSAIVIQLGAIERVSSQDNPQLSIMAGELRSYAAESLTDIRQTLSDLHPAALTDTHLGPALEELIKEFRQATKINIELNENIADLSLNDKIELALYRAVQEFLSNAVRHGRATEIRVRIHWAAKEGTLILSMRDNGIGAGHYVPHQGLHGIEERVRELSGEMSIETAPGEGFFTRISLPLPGDTEDIL